MARHDKNNCSHKNVGKIYAEALAKANSDRFILLFVLLFFFFSFLIIFSFLFFQLYSSCKLYHILQNAQKVTMDLVV